MTASRCIGQQGELVCSAPFPSVPIGFWGDAGRRALARNLLRALSERVVARRLRHDHPARRAHRARSLRCRAQPWRRAHRHRRDLPPGREASRKSPNRSPSRSNGRAMCASCSSSDCATASTLDDALRDKIRGTIRGNTTPRHVPARIVQAPDLPRTINGKLVELAVREVVHGRPVKNLDALANPQALDFFKDLPSCGVKVAEPYERECARLGYSADPAQRQVVALSTSCASGCRREAEAAARQQAAGRLALRRQAASAAARDCTSVGRRRPRQDLADGPVLPEPAVQRQATQPLSSLHAVGPRRAEEAQGPGQSARPASPTSLAQQDPRAVLR